MSRMLTSEEIKIRNARIGVLFDANESITSLTKSTLGTETPTKFLFGLDVDGAWISFEQVREVTQDGETRKENTRITIYLSPEASEKIVAVMEQETLAFKREQSGHTG